VYRPGNPRIIGSPEKGLVEGLSRMRGNSQVRF
jgi:hypothetical protein